MKCNYCGSEYEGNFCPGCGARAEAKPSDQSSQMQNSFSDQDMKTSGSQKRKTPIYKKWWIYVIAAVVLISIICMVFAGKGNSEKIEWSEIILNNWIPEPPTNKGTLYINTDEELRISLVGVSDKQYSDYLNSCVEKGYTVDTDKMSFSYKAYNTDGYSLDLNYIDNNLSIALEAPMQFDSITWPSGTAGKLLPAPKSTIGKFAFEYDDNFRVYIGNTSRGDYDDYVKACSDKGFTVDYNKGDAYYYADNGDGWHISLVYEGNNIMSIDIDAPSEKPDDSTPDSPTPAPSSDSEKPSEPEPSETKPNDTDLVDGMHKDFKEAMDSYEAFMDEYVAFMKKYRDNPGDVGMLSDYTNYMSKYTDVVNKFNNWESKDLNTVEIAYYIDVQARVSKKLIEVSN